MSDGSATTPGPGEQSGEQQPQNPAAVPPQAAPPAAQFPSHAQPQAPAPGQQPIQPQPGFPAASVPPASGYGYPPAQPTYGYPPAQGGGYGYPPPQGGYGYPPLAQAGEPDWMELAEQNEAANRRRKRLLMISGGVLAVAAVVGIVATTLVLSGKKDGTSQASVTGSPSAAPTDGGDDGDNGTPAPAPTSPEGFISRVKTDTVPLNVKSLFADDKITTNGHQYSLAATDVTNLKDCSGAADADLAKVLNSNGCLHVFRATYVNGPVAVTLAIVDFPNSGNAVKTVSAASSMTVKALADGNAPKFCQGDTACRTSRDSLGRYLMVALAGRSDGKPATAADKAIPVAARDLVGYANTILTARGKAAMDAARTAPAGSPAPSSSPTG
ncbi:hypothetical protein [Kitasatospora sp. GP82]|uniref:hypothetical protein n=1 Tax=Kitasatospora sp. GP82 TaxID=3035089 RepID=UPI0024762D09|nr:hypothetical protein [Kitasatospora sp. GP82]MDH6124261.1 hypothetical protein [Kitasatospora sp. GP82]